MKKSKDFSITNYIQKLDFIIENNFKYYLFNEYYIRFDKDGFFISKEPESNQSIIGYFWTHSYMTYQQQFEENKGGTLDDPKLISIFGNIERNIKINEFLQDDN